MRFQQFILPAVCYFAYSRDVLLRFWLKWCTSRCISRSTCTAHLWSWNFTVNPLNLLLACDCDEAGSTSKFCHRASGQCSCRSGISGRRCDRCKAGFYLFPQCLACSCNGHADTCDQTTGRCIECRDDTMGDHCETWVENRFLILIQLLMQKFVCKSWSSM